MAKIRDKVEDSVRRGQFKTLINVKELGVPDGKEERNVIFDALATRVAERWNGELTCRVLWDHPDCSYCEPCGAGCKPAALEVSVRL